MSVTTKQGTRAFWICSSQKLTSFARVSRSTDIDINIDKN